MSYESGYLGILFLIFDFLISCKSFKNLLYNFKCLIETLSVKMYLHGYVPGEGTLDLRIRCVAMREQGTLRCTLIA